MERSRKRRNRNRKRLKMVAWKTWLCLKQSFLVPTKCLLIKLTSRSRHKPKGNGNGLVNLYKDIESCGEYADIKVMWEMIHSCPQNSKNSTERRKRSSSYWRFCVHPST
ncbi:hypothetical protein M0R45_028902 [Rubus argutus]|uniref:Uncharacterized protein n=1 Tax=Rubus argutus TaxID=59490 RepID=A0AAW1W6M4_RUBAR